MWPLLDAGIGARSLSIGTVSAHDKALFKSAIGLCKTELINIGATELLSKQSAAGPKSMAARERLLNDFDTCVTSTVGFSSGDCLAGLA